MRPKLVKFCGITRSNDAQWCVNRGADALGFIFYPKSPRNLLLNEVPKLFGSIDFKKCLKVAVAVSPSVELVKGLVGAGFERFQFHFPTHIPDNQIYEWSTLVGRENLWLAPRLKPSEELPPNYLEYTKHFLLDAYSEKTFGGTGKRADWVKFFDLKQQYSSHKWILAGGLSPENLAAAISSTSPDGIDLNSGVESEPGKKDQDKIARIFDILAH